jgi:hypothetical protein
MTYDQQFHIRKVPIWIAEVDGVPIHKTNHPKRFIFVPLIRNKLHAEQLVDHFSLITVDLREDFYYEICDGMGIGVGPRFNRYYEHRVVHPPPFPRELNSDCLFKYLCDAEAVLSRLQSHFRYLLVHVSKLPIAVRGELANLLKPVLCLTEEDLSLLKTGLLEKPRRKTSLSRFLDSEEPEP